METQISRACKALGDPTRVQIYEFLHKCCCSTAVEEDGSMRPACGPTVGEVCCQVTGEDKMSSTISFHLKELREAGLITMEKQGKYQICRINRETLAKVSEYFGTAAAEASCSCGCDCGENCGPNCQCA